MRKTKIVCTLGLVSNTKKMINELMDAGMDVARFNFSHGDHDSHKQMLDIVKKLRDEKNIPVATLLDTRGPEIRIGLFKDSKVELKAGNKFILCTDEVEGDENKVSITFKEITSDLSVGNRVLIDDGLIELKVERIDLKGGKVHCIIVNGGTVSNRKGVNLPDISPSMPYISAQDKKDIEFGVNNGFDFIAASFVRSNADVIELRELMNSFGGETVGIIAKIENAAGVENIDEILRSVEGIMVARGDMGVEVPFEDLPPLQKILIQKGYQSGKMVITATQMLESMINNPRPTRAEVSDVANAVYDGTSAIMLSGETAAGKYPVESVKTMATIAERTENDVDYQKRFHNSPSVLDNTNVTNAISHATCTTAYDLEAKAIITVTISGRTARNISKYRPNIPIYGCTTSEQTYHQLALSWGVVPVRISMQKEMDILFDISVDKILDVGDIDNGDLVVITTGVPLGVAGTTNLIKVHIAGDVLVSGTGLGSRHVSGRLCVAKNTEDAIRHFSTGDILVVKNTSNELLPILKHASAIVCEEEGMQSHAAIVGLSLDIPVILNAKNALNILKSGIYVTIDEKRGVVCSDSSIKKKKGK